MSEVLSVNITRSKDNTSRIFRIAGKSSTLPEGRVYNFNDKNDADEQGCYIASQLFNYKGVTNVKLLSNNGNDCIAIKADNAELWEKQNNLNFQTANGIAGSGASGNVEQSVKSLIEKHVGSNNPLIVESGQFSTIEEINAYLQNNLPKAVSDHGGSAVIDSFDRESSSLKVIFGDVCATSGCPSGQFGTRLAIKNTLRQRYPYIRNVNFENRPV